MRSFRILFSALTFALATSASAQDFFSPGEPERLFDIGLRLGLNASNRTFPGSAFNRWNVNSWGTGIDAGCVVDINIRDYISLQPGIFIGSRSGNYSYTQVYYDKNGNEDDFTQLGHDRSASITVPVLASVKFNLSGDLRLVAEAGPYVEWFFHDSASSKVQVIMPQSAPKDPIVVHTAKPETFDVGLKIGTGLSFRRRYSFFIHYLAGGKKAWETPYRGGHNKAWTFTIGYDL